MSSTILLCPRQVYSSQPGVPVELSYDDSPVEAVIETAVKAVSGLAKKCGVSIVTEPSPAMFFADTERLVQVVINLLSNAIKFSPHGDTVALRVMATPERVQLEITDQGRGVPAHLKEAIFERFKQVDRTDDTKMGGSGLGLAICKAIVERHEGKIGVNSEEGKGSTFWFRIPVSSRKTN